jgi:PAS domain S-box-containing protein
VDFPEAEVLAPAHAYLLNIAAIAGLFVLAALVASAVLGRGITHPLADLTRASEALAAGDYSHTVTDGRPDELGRLGRAFNSMLRQIREAHEALQARVAESADALAALKDSEARHRAIVQVALDCIITIDVDGIVTEFNPSAEQTFGFRRETAIGRELAELIIPPEYRAAHREGLARYLRTEEGQVIGRRSEMVAMRADGSRLPVELAIQSVRIDGRRMFTAYLRDITPRREAEEARVRAVELQAENRQVREASRLICGRSL